MRKRQVISRRNLIRTTAATAVAAGGAGLWVANANASNTPKAGGTLNLNIVNKNGSYKNDSVWVYIVGNDGTDQAYVTADGELKKVSADDNKSDGYTDYSIPLTGDTTTIKLPEMSGRVYFALGDKLKFKAQAGSDGKAALAYPAGWVSSDPNYNVMHDCAEFTFKDGNMYCNTTMVDMFSIPLAIELKGSKTQTTGELKDGARAKIFSDVKGAEGFDKLVIDDKRVIAPGHGLGSGLFADDYFQSYIDQVWEQYAGKELTVTTNAGKFTGKVDGDKFSFTGPGNVSFSKPSTQDVLFCDGNLAAPNDGTTGPVAAILGAGFNRSTLLSDTNQPGTDPSKFYQEKITNYYSKAMHDATKDGKAYGFAFDDVASFASYIQDSGPTDWTITLTPMS